MAYDLALYYGGHISPIAATSTSFTDAVILPASRMVAGRKYLLLVTAGIAAHSEVAGGSNGLNVRVVRGASVSLGSTAYYTDFFNGALPAENDRHVRPYSYMTVFTQPGTAVDIKVQLATQSGQTSGHLYDCTIVALDINSLVQGTDYLFSEDDDSGAPTSLPVDIGGTVPSSHTSFSTLTLPGGAAYWLVIGNVCEHNTLKQGRYSEFYIDDGGVKRLLFYDNSSPNNSLSNFIISNVPGAGTKAVTVKGFARTDDFGSVYPRHHSSRLFALKFTPGGASTGHGVGADLGEPAFRQDTPVSPGSVAPGGGLTPSAGQSWMWLTSAYGTGNTPVVISQRRNVTDTSTMDGPAWPEDCDNTCGVWNLRHPVMRASALRCSGSEVLGDQFAYTTQGATVEGDCHVGGYRRFFLRLPTWNATADGDTAAAAPTAAGIGSTDQPEIFGDGDTETAAPTASGAGRFTPQSFGGAGSTTTTAPTASGAGTFHRAEYHGDGDTETAAPTAAGTGTFHIEPRTGSGVAETATPTASGLGSFQHAACAAFQYSQHGREPISVCQVLGHGHDYPLVTPSEDIRYLLADLFLSYEDPYDYGEADQPFELPLHIAFLFGPGCLVNDHPDYLPDTALHAADIVIRDNAGRDVFDSTQATVYRSTDWGNRLRVHEWLLGAQVCRIALHTKWRDAQDSPAPRDYDIYLEPDHAPIDPRAVRRLPKRVRSLIVDGEPLQGEVELVGGYNTELVAAGSLAEQSDLLVALVALPQGGGRAGQRIEVGMQAGSGEGRAPGCEDVELNLTTINNVPPNEHGDFVLGGDACYWFEKTSEETAMSESIDGIVRSVVSTVGVLTMHNDCEPCCKCEDFVETKLAIDNLYETWQQLANDAQEVRDTYVDNRSRWLAAKECFDNDRVRLTLTASCLGYVGLGFIFCPTDTDGCTGPLEVKFEFLLNATEGDRDPDPPPVVVPDPPDEPEPDGNNTLGPELLQNHNFAQARQVKIDRSEYNFVWVSEALPWTLRGAVSAAGQGWPLALGAQSPTTYNMHPQFGTFFNLLGEFGWNSEGETHDGNEIEGLPIQLENFVFVIGNYKDGGSGRIYQTSLVDPGEYYKTTVGNIRSLHGTIRLRATDGDGSDIAVEELAPFNEAATDPFNIDSGFAARSITYLVPTDRVTHALEAEVSAGDWIAFYGMSLIAVSGRAFQTVSNIKPTAKYRALIALAKATEGKNYVEILNADEEVIATIEIADGSPRYTILEKIFVANTTKLTFLMRGANEAPGEEKLYVLDTSLREVLDTVPGEEPEPTTGNPGPSQGGTTPTGTTNLDLKLLPDSGRKSEVGNKEMIPYDLDGEMPQLTATWDRIDSGQTARVVFAVVPCHAIEGDSLTVTATPTLNGIELDPITKTVSLKFECPDIDELCSDS